jgi:ABC-type spermidine/putrescine transport system permease subunit I
MNRLNRSTLAWPAVAYLAVLFLVPVLVVLGYSLLERDYHGGVEGRFSLAAWRQAVDSITLRTLVRTLGLASAVTLATMVIGYPCAAALSRTSNSAKQLLIFAFCFPLVTSLLLRTYGWMNLLPIHWQGNLACIALVLTFNYLPFMVLPLLRAYERMDPMLERAALDLGATPWQAFWRVKWPLTSGGMWAGAALVFIPVMGEYLVPHFIGQGRVPLLGTVIWKEFESRNWPYAAACAIWLVLFVTAVLLAAAWQGRWDRWTRGSSLDKGAER